MERTKPEIAAASAFQMHEVADHLHNVGGVKNALYCFPIDFLHDDDKISKKK